MPHVIHFEIHADDPERAIAFYNSVFGWEFEPFGLGEYWLITAGDDEEPGINGGLTRRASPAKKDGFSSYICIILVEKIEAAVEKVKRSGGKDTVPITAVPGHGWLAYCEDTEGNTFGIFQQDPGAT